MIFIEKDLALFDDLELFNLVYQPQLGDTKSQLKPRDEFYQIWTPFYMNSQLKNLMNDEKEPNTGKRKRRKRKAPSPPLEGGEMRDFLFSNCRHVRSLFEKFKSTFKSFDDANNQRTNEIARHCVKMAPLFHHSVLFADGSGLLETTAEPTGETTRRFSAQMAEIVPFCDVALTRHFLSQRFDKFDFIVADPPWPNRTVKRQRTYQMFRAGKLSLDHPLDRLGQLPIPQILADGALFCIWLSNSRTAHTVAHELLDKWKMRKLAQWHWLKICRTGEPVCAFRPEHKVPFESLLIACKDCAADTAKWEKIPKDFCVVSVPNANPSRKPPISLLLQQLGFICPVKNGLELYARYLLPNFTSVGYEATKIMAKFTNKKREFWE
uniref:Methyltransferase-like protein 4 n=1 Tax=Globodera rostochiensis TaxID=31243 RepID=A0A914HWX9_GLORO